MKKKISNILRDVFTWWKQLHCKYEKWDCDTQIKTIECSKKYNKILYKTFM
jgi:hypothetical protein